MLLAWVSIISSILLYASGNFCLIVISPFSIDSKLFPIDLWITAYVINSVSVLVCGMPAFSSETATLFLVSSTTLV